MYDIDEVCNFPNDYSIQLKNTGKVFLPIRPQFKGFGIGLTELCYDTHDALHMVSPLTRDEMRYGYNWGYGEQKVLLQGELRQYAYCCCAVS